VRTYDPQLRIYGFLTMARITFGYATLSGKNASETESPDLQPR
jgi:hypothetical protein